MNIFALDNDTRRAALEEAAEICDKLAQKWADSGNQKEECILYADSIYIRMRKDGEEANVNEYICA